MYPPGVSIPRQEFPARPLRFRDPRVRRILRAERRKPDFLFAEVITLRETDNRLNGLRRQDVLLDGGEDRVVCYVNVDADLVLTATLMATS